MLQRKKEKGGREESFFQAIAIKWLYQKIQISTPYFSPLREEKGRGGRGSWSSFLFIIFSQYICSSRLIVGGFLTLKRRRGRGELQRLPDTSSGVTATHLAIFLSEVWTPEKSGSFFSEWWSYFSWLREGWREEEKTKTRRGKQVSGLKVFNSVASQRDRITPPPPLSASHCSNVKYVEARWAVTKGGVWPELTQA